MAIKLSAALANDLLDGASLKGQLDQGFIYIFAGAVPADADAALDMTVTTGVHTLLAKIAADAVPADSGTLGLTFASSATNRAIVKNSSQTWAGKVNFVGKDQDQAGVGPLTATFYRFGGSLGTGGIQPPVANTPTTSTSGGTLAAGTYYYVVSTLNAAGESARSNEVSVVTSGSTSSNTITWAAVPGATGYRIYRGTAAGGENVYYSVGVVTTYTDTNAASTGGTPLATDNCQGVGTANTPRIQGSVATAGGDINLTSTSLSDNGTNTVGLSTYEVRIDA